MSVSAFLNLGSEINTIYPTFAQELGFLIWLRDVGVQKIDDTRLDTYRMIVAAFSVIGKAN